MKIPGSYPQKFQFLYLWDMTRNLHFWYGDFAAVHGLRSTLETISYQSFFSCCTSKPLNDLGEHSSVAEGLGRS